MHKSLVLPQIEGMTTDSINTLRLEKVKFEALFHYATIGIVISNSHGEITLINAHAEQIFGYEPNELVAKKVEELLPDSAKARHIEHRKSYTIHPEVRPMGSGRDLMARRKDGSEFPVEVSLSYFHLEDGLFVIAFIQDISTRKKKDETLKNQRDELEKITLQVKGLNANLEKEVEKRTKDLQETLTQLEASRGELQKALEREQHLGELKSRFVTMASHEFKTPLSTILTSTTLISKYKKEGEQENRDKHLKRITESVQNLTALLNEFLSIGKLDEGKVGLKKEEFFIGELIEELASEMEQQAKAGQYFTVKNGTVGFPSFQDKTITRNILVNLISNAIKFSPENSEIFIESKIENNMVEIKVKDNGIGIPKEDQKDLFSRFFRARNAENISGTGLGLHIVQRYVDLLEGNIQFESTQDKGTTFTLLLPLQ